jgi:hypothetical protein
MGLADGLDSIVGDEFKSVEGTFAKDSEYRVFSLEFSSEGVASSSLLTPEELSESMLDRLVTAEDGPVGLTRVAESAGRALWDGADGLSERELISKNCLSQRRGFGSCSNSEAGFSDAIQFEI